MIKKLRFYFMTLVCVSFFTTFLLATNFFDSFKNERSKDLTCGRYPEEGDVFTDNIIWQVLQTSFGFIYLLNAYLDERWNQRIVRVNIISQKLNISSQKLFCQFWFDDKSTPIVVEASEFQSIWFNSK